MQLFLFFLRLWKGRGQRRAVGLGLKGEDIFWYFVLVWEGPV